MIKLVLDTDVIVAAMRSPIGASAALLGEALKKRLILLASVPLFIEYEAKCTESEHLTAAGLTQLQSQMFLDGIAAIVQPVKTHYLWRPMLHDPNDEMVLEIAVNGGADAKMAKRDGTSLNQFISMAVAEKISALETEEFFRERAKRANLKMFEDILYRQGGESPREGDEVEK
ncbi:putative toxin-antitoxin system toxin component, PIN family [Nitrosomonas sp.]|uniref:putative toxin-antitoxin system toxin component, PIN family n=1 Tax=Nitrosomonas sp. TaxID=42353 RepID=UPI0025F45AD9|nr:putative toxin-antitoxin system toxin component, PIN family [Nitrosomonas sp.]MBY0483174.1 putative toxin-antitoxin system toxin component, PIN family [Nitrosomonas sp.]